MKKGTCARQPRTSALVEVIGPETGLFLSRKILVMGVSGLLRGLNDGVSDRVEGARLLHIQFATLSVPWLVGALIILD
jgi:hypothetical protein